MPSLAMEATCMVFVTSFVLVLALARPKLASVADPNLPNYVDKAVPFFLTCIGTELAISLWKERRMRATGKPGNAGNRTSPYPYFRFNDSLNSLSAGILQQMLHLVPVVKPLLLLPYIWVWEKCALVRMKEDSWLTFWLCFFLVELGYYWYHRLGHECSAFWAAHVVHHSSQEYNLTTALRQGAIQYAFAFLFYAPIGLLIPPSVFNLHMHFNRIYQFWIHTELIRRFPAPIEYIFNTPSHHRVHHAANAIYIDKNYGGTLIIYDRMFGTFQAELDSEQPVYGLTHNINSWNPLWANAHEWNRIFRSMWRMRLSPLRKLRILWNGPGWNPRPGAQPYAIPPVDPTKPRYNATPSNWLYRAYILVQFATAVAALRMIPRFPDASAVQWLLCSYIVLALVSVGAHMDGVWWKTPLEVLRTVVTAVAVAVWAAINKHGSFNAASSTYKLAVATGAVLGLSLSAAVLYVKRPLPSAVPVINTEQPGRGSKHE